MQARRLIFLATLIFEAKAEAKTGRDRSFFRGDHNLHIRHEHYYSRAVGEVKLAKTLRSLRIEIETETETGINNTHMISDASDSLSSPSLKSKQNKVHFYQTASFVVCCCLILVFFCCLITTFCAKPTRCFGLYKLQYRLGFDDSFTDNDTNNNNENTRNSYGSSSSSDHNLDTSSSSHTSSITSHQHRHDQDISRMEANIVKFNQQEQRMKKKLLVSKWRNYRMVITSKDLLPLSPIFDISLDSTKNTATIHTTLQSIDKPNNANHLTFTTTSADANLVAEDCCHHHFLSEEDACRLILPVIVTTNQTSALPSTNSTQILGRSLNQDNTTHGADSRINNNRTTDMSKETDVPLSTVRCSSVTKLHKPQPPQQREEVKNVNRQVSGHCAICLCAYKVGDVIVWSNNLECPHVFHEECILQWMVMTNNYRHSLCPCCRQQFVLDTTTYVTSSTSAINAVVSGDSSGFSSISSSKFISDSSNCSEPLAVVTHEDHSVPLSHSLSSQNDETNMDTLNNVSGSTS